MTNSIVAIPETKTCSKCGETKPVGAFPSKGRVCKKCLSEYQRVWRKTKKGKDYYQKYEQDRKGNSARK